MFFYIESDNYLINQTNNIISDLNQLQKRENRKLHIILSFLSKLNYFTEANSNINNTQSIINMLETIKCLTDSLRTNIENFENLKKILKNLFLESNDNSIVITENTKVIIDDYNRLAKDYKSKYFLTSEQFDNFITEYIQNIPNSSSISQIDAEVVKPDIIEESQEVKNTDSTSELEDNNVLLISETQKKVFLPYLIEDLNKILYKNKKYKTIQEIISSKYILPISRFKSPTIARFKEGYNLMKNKEKASIIESLDLALELAFNNSLNPAIITACRNLDELDTYLDCLENNSPEDFNKFEIKYEVLPQS